MKTFLKLLLLTLMVLALVGCNTAKNEPQSNPEPSGTNEVNTQESATPSEPAEASPEETTIQEPESELESEPKTETNITPEMALQGIDAYCHFAYDWSIAEENPDIMYVQMGEETDTEYQVVFRSYTGAFVYYFVDKTTGTTRIVETAPNAEDETETETQVGTINLFDYLNN